MILDDPRIATWTSQMPTKVLSSLRDIFDPSNLPRTIRLVIQRLVRFRLVSLGTPSKKNGVSGRWEIYTNVVKSFIIKMRTERHRVVRSIRSCRRYCRWRSRRRRNGIRERIDSSSICRREWFSVVPMSCRNTERRTKASVYDIRYSGKIQQ